MSLIFDSNDHVSGGLIFDSNTYLSGDFIGVANKSTIWLVSRSSTGTLGQTFNGVAVKSYLPVTGKVSGGGFGGTFVGDAVKSEIPINAKWPGFLQDPEGITKNDVYSEPVNIELLNDVAVGVLDLYVDGGFTYTAPNNFNGEVSFDYRLWEAGIPSNIATVTINVVGGFIGSAISGKLPYIGNTSTIVDGFNENAAKTNIPLTSRSALSTLGLAFIGTAMRSALMLKSNISILQFGTGFTGTARKGVITQQSRASSMNNGFEPVAITGIQNVNGSITTLTYGNYYLAVTGVTHVQGNASLFPYPGVYFMRGAGTLRSFRYTGHITKLQ